MGGIPVGDKRLRRRRRRRKGSNKASPKLLLACACGEHIKKAVLTCRKAGKDQQEFLKVTMSDILVTSYQTGGAESSGVVPMDQISLNFAKIEHEYKEQKSDGSLGGAIKAGYDLKANKKV
jgi:type VI secretion system secreted protein Hcp